MRLLIPALTLLLTSAVAFAQMPEGDDFEAAIEHEPATAHAAEHEAAHEHLGPTLPYDTIWSGVIVIVIFGMFVSAALVGPIVRANAPEEMPVTHAHDEPPGSSGHHGHSGTKNPEPDHGHGSGHGHH